MFFVVTESVIVCDVQCFCCFRAALFGRFRAWLGDVLGVELEPTVDISCAKYEYTGEIYLGGGTPQRALRSCCIQLTVNHILSYFKIPFCATMTSWRGGALLSFCILCLHGREATGAPSISTQQTVGSSQRVSLQLYRYLSVTSVVR